LLGYFKAPQHAEWFKQLFKHEGNCVWEDDEYEFMQRHREAWPEHCAMSAVRDHGSVTGNYLYYDAKPSAYATMDIGLYTDERCMIEHTGSISAQTVLYTNTTDTDDDDDGGSGDEGSAYDLVEELQAWNEAFGIFKTCLLCKTFDMNTWSLIWTAGRSLIWTARRSSTKSFALLVFNSGQGFCSRRLR
jgi:hypothetical protein